MYFDWSYVLMVLPAVLFAMWANRRVSRVFQKYQNTPSQRRITGAQAARQVLDANGLRGVPIDQITGNLTDHYDPIANVVRLSNAVYGSTSTASIGVACHEVGHALQYADGYAPIKVRASIIPLTNFGSKLAMPLIIAGLIIGSFSYYFTYLAYVGIVLFGICTLFQLLTLPVEFNASRRALESIQQYRILNESELGGAKEVLDAAALTYVAALAVSLMQLLRFIMILRRRR